MTISKLLIYGIEYLNGIDDKDSKASMLLEYVLDKDRARIIAYSDEEVSEEKEDEYKKLLEEVKQGKPIQYITHIQEFYGEKFYVDENVLIPQPDTEILVEETIKKAKEIQLNMESRIRILDMCTGTGCIGISIAKNLDNAEVHMADISEDALNIARKNAIKVLALHENFKNLQFIQTDMFENINLNYDIIVSNPPYISREEMQELPQDVKREPFIALYGGLDGLDFYKRIRNEGEKYLYENGVMLLEIGNTQGEQVTDIFENSTIVKDLENRDRVVIWKKEI